MSDPTEGYNCTQLKPHNEGEAEFQPQIPFGRATRV